jgi:hypothetical protein
MPNGTTNMYGDQVFAVHTNLLVQIVTLSFKRMQQEASEKKAHSGYY